MNGPRGWWGRQSTPAKVETYTRWSFHSFALVEFAVMCLPVLAQTRPGVAYPLAVLVALHCAGTAVTTSRAVDWSRGRRARPVRELALHGTFTVLVAGTALLLARYGTGGERLAGNATSTVYGGVLAFGAGTLTLGFRGRRRVSAVVGAFAGGSAVLGALLGMPWPAALGTALAVFLGAGFLAFTTVFSVWLLDAVYELDAARETRARLAVAEERLRFGRDLHDVLGRNLSVISLKSELAVQLARRGRPEAVEQMIEVQRVAQESQREVRAVVRGYREADLAVELVGAQGVLTAAGIECRVRAQEADGLPAEVRAALGWVVREATTNVLRHGDPGHCSLELSQGAGRVVLVVENDGVGTAGSAGAGSGGRGSGLDGLRERLTAVGGTLAAGPAGAGRFRLVAEVPVGPGQRGAEPSTAAGEWPGGAGTGGAAAGSDGGGSTGGGVSTVSTFGADEGEAGA
ncbi:sensor histidine kinase [Streptomyces sp. J2-1]|uniref:sensor histidine kinase n=1 Tax=Streptomyces corallincola TaxID=2851888 RepID=UPI001C393550|nr:histidine kinase [Streptomyces corallincola]MBV2357977.1 sensor histidine kinase [Streptomyces corallincola]